MSSANTPPENLLENKNTIADFNSIRAKLKTIEKGIDYMDSTLIKNMFSDCKHLEIAMKTYDLELYTDYIIIQAKFFIQQELLFQAKTMLIEANDISQKSFQYKRPQICFLLAIVYTKRGSYPEKARLLVKKAIEICLDLISQSDKTNINLANCLAIGYLNCGVLENSYGNTKKALESFSEGLRFIKKADVDESICEKYTLLRRQLKINTFLKLEFNESDEESCQSKEEIEVTNNLRNGDSNVEETDGKYLKMMSDKDKSPTDIIKKFATRVSAIITSQTICFSTALAKSGYGNDNLVPRKSIRIENSTRKDSNKKNGKISDILKKDTEESLTLTLTKCFIFIKHFLESRLRRIKRRSELMLGYIAYGKRNINGHKYFVSFKANIQHSTTLENSQTMLQGNLVILSGFPLESKCKKLRESCYIVEEILEMLGAVDLNLATTYNQVSLLDHIDCNEYGRIILKKPKANTVIQKRLLYKGSKYLGNENYMVKIFHNSKNNPDEIDVCVEGKSTKKMFPIICKNLRDIKNVFDAVNEVDGEIKMIK
ncbi:hypothetical protein SteCoe_31843 [Stentor coeruleus]|uniref:Uncharacterized protein n=1 Tax=Stentor coeruleus TaxID=5963 RepID=A0A1R2B0D7_9CILI|nr:hypothetical protein SteCoe_31843 [Stentor coeruleus]